MKKYMSVFGILAIVTMGAYAEDVVPETELDTVIEELVAEPAEDIIVEKTVPEPEVNMVVEEVVPESEVTAVEEVVPEPEVVEVTNRANSDDYYTVFMNQYKQDEGTVVAEGNMGDFLTYIAATPEILDMYNNKAKTAVFLSFENPIQYVQSEKCIVNTIPYNTWKELGMENDEVSHCAWRLFCGGEIQDGVNYAVEFCDR